MLYDVCATACGVCNSVYNSMFVQVGNCYASTPLRYGLLCVQQSEHLWLQLMCTCRLTSSAGCAVLPCCLWQVGRQSPLYDDFFCSPDVQQRLGDHARSIDKQGAAKQRKQKKGQSDLLLIHAGPLKATPGALPLQQQLLERTVLNEQEVGHISLCELLLCQGCLNQGPVISLTAAAMINCTGG